MRKKLKRFIAILLSLQMLLILIPAMGLNVEAATKIKLAKKSVSIVIGETSKIKVKNVPEGAKITYKSEKKSVAAVSEEGKVNGIKSGTANITVSMKNNSKTTKLTYKVTVKKPKLSKSRLSVPSGSTVKLSVKNKPRKAKYTWSSDNPKIAAVSKNGKVTAKASGTAIIRVKIKTAKKAYSSSCKVIIKLSSNEAVNRYGVRWEKGNVSTLDGKEVATASHLRTGYIDISTYQSLSFEVSDGSCRYNVIWFDKKKKFIGYLDYGTDLTHNYNDVVNVPKGSVYARFIIYRSGGIDLSSRNWLKITGNSDKSDEVIYKNVYGEAVGNHVAKYNNLYEDNRVGYIWISDLHLNSIKPNNTSAIKRQLKAVCEIADKTDIDFVCIGGDVIDAEQSRKNYEKMLNICIDGLKNCSKPVAYITGNHDDNAYGNKDAFVGKDFVKTFREKTTVKNAQYPDEESAYYYFDLKDKQTRVICMDMIDYAEGKKGSNWWSESEKQVKWFAQQALDTDNDIIVLCHQCLDYKYNFYALGNNGNYSNDMMDVIAAYNSRSKIELYGTKYDFSNSKGKIKYQHAGHAHYDKSDIMVGGVPCIITACAKNQTKINGTTHISGDTYEMTEGNEYKSNTTGYLFNIYKDRTYETINEALFDIVSVNGKEVNVIRLGAGRDRKISIG